MELGQQLLDVYDRLLAEYGPQHWWPAETRFEVMVGAVLTQAAAWGNVQQAIDSLKAAGALSAGAIRDIDERDLARLVYSSGYYNAKARKLKALARYLGERFGDDLDAMSREDAGTLRVELLTIHGIGEETADDILLVRRQNKWDKRGAFEACNLDANRLRQFSDLPTSVRLDSFASPPVSSPVWRLAVRGTYPPA